MLYFYDLVKIFAYCFMSVIFKEIPCVLQFHWEDQKEMIQNCSYRAGESYDGFCLPGLEVETCCVSELSLELHHSLKYILEKWLYFWIDVSFSASSLGFSLIAFMF